ncbi:hypothetical protein ACWCPQ_34790 [Nocardia sp. NPDC001965]
MPRVVTSLSTGLLVGAFSIVVPVAIWPGEAKLTAPLFCSSPTTEPVVVSDTFHDSDGTYTNYTLYCVGDHGILTDAGFVLPMLVMLTAHFLIATALALLVTSRARRTEPGRPVRDPLRSETHPHIGTEDYFEH